MTDQTIVVPLDGSELSERAIPYATLFAEKMKARILLVTVWEGAEEALVQTLPAVAEDLFKEGQQYYAKYLKDVAARHKSAGVRVDAEVLTGRPADKLLDLIEARGAALLVMSSHGRSGVGRWWYGSVAGELAREASSPRLMIGPKVLAQPAKQIKIDAVLVPLDGSPLSEAALAPAAEVAKLFGATLHLAQVLSPVSQSYFFEMPSVAAVDVERELEHAAASYLTSAAERTGAAPTETKVLRGPAADALIDYGEEAGVDLVVMATHGRGGIVRAALGSVADRMLQGPAPVYLVRPSAG